MVSVYEAKEHGLYDQLLFLKMLFHFIRKTTLLINCYILEWKSRDEKKKRILLNDVSKILSS